jgi:glycosyltransferase involved in cell wall biosynthesis
MKILITTSFYPPYHIGGACTHCKYLAEALVKEGHEVHVLASLDAYYFKRGYEKKIVEGNGVKIHWMQSPLGRLEPIFNYTFGTQPYTYNYFRKLVKKEKFDVVHHHNISLLGSKLLKKIGNYKNLYTAHDFWLICPKYDLLKNGKVCEQKKNCALCCLSHRKPYPLAKINVKDLDYIISPSQYMANKLIQFGLRNIIVINNFVPEIKIESKIKEKDYFLFVGQIEVHKGILELIKVFSQIDRRLVILGIGSKSNLIKDTSNISYLGFKTSKEVYSYMKGAEALILPSQCPENNSMVILESYMVGTPAIASNLGGNPELIELVDKKLCFQWNDFNQLKEIILKYDRKKYKNLPKFNFKNYYKKYKKIIYN